MRASCDGSWRVRLLKNKKKHKVRTMLKKSVVGVVVNEGTFSKLWNNGMSQNIVTYCTMLAKEFAVHVICPSPSDEPAFAKTVPPAFRFVPLAQLLDHPCDIYLEMSSSTTPDQFHAIKQAKPCAKFVILHFGGARRLLLTSILENKKMMIGNNQMKQYDECWTSPHYAKDEWFLRKVFQCDTFRTMPYVWDPQYIQQACDKITGKPFKGYVPVPSGKKKTIACMEPNIDTAKMSLVPISIVDEAYKVCSDSVQTFEVFNAVPLISSPTFRFTYVPTHQILRNGVAQFWKSPARIMSAHVFTRPGNILVSHHMDNGLNYLSLEALYLGVPIVHNSEELREAGYYYPESDIGAGAKALVRAVEMHDLPENMEGYRRSGMVYVWKYSPTNPENRKALYGAVRSAIEAVPTRPYRPHSAVSSGLPPLKIVDLSNAGGTTTSTSASTSTDAVEIPSADNTPTTAESSSSDAVTAATATADGDGAPTV